MANISTTDLSVTTAAQEAGSNNVEHAFHRAGADSVWVLMLVLLLVVLALSVWKHGFLRANQWHNFLTAAEKPAAKPAADTSKLACPTSIEELQRAAAIVLAFLLIIVAVVAWCVGLLYMMLVRKWLTVDYPCFVAYDGVVCNQTFVVALGDPEWQQSDLPSKATTRIYAGAALFVVLILLTVAIHQWRLASVSGRALYQQQPAAKASLGTAEAHVPSPLAPTYSEASWARALALLALQRVRQPMSYLWRDWAQPVITGAVVGAAMAFYQVLLQCVMCAVWGSDFINEGNSVNGRNTKAMAVVAIPAVLLSASGVLQAYLKGGNAAQFVAAVNYNWDVDAFRGLISTSVVSIVGIASGGSAGPEGPVLYIGAAIGQLMRFRGPAALFSSGAIDTPPIASTAPLALSASDWRKWWQLSGSRTRSKGDDALIGGAAAIAAFFDHPVSGCLFVMELPHMHGSMHKGDVLPSALIASTVAWLSHRMIMDAANIMPPPILPPVCTMPIGELWLALPLGVFIGFISYCFVRTRQLLDTLPYPTWVRGFVLGSIVGLVGLFMPDTLTWGEFQIEILADFRLPLSTPASTGLAIAKFSTIIMTIASGCTHDPCSAHLPPHCCCPLAPLLPT
jgi:H+/Cl- antiporter ClcA